MGVLARACVQRLEVTIQLHSCLNAPLGRRSACNPCCSLVERCFCNQGTYASLLVSGKFFPLGWGDLNAINFHQDLSCMKEWPPAGIKMDKWKEALLSTEFQNRLPAVLKHSFCSFI
eukprot:scaffold173292_cov19-Tisochrysis_lutea.AAC.1